MPIRPDPEMIRMLLTTCESPLILSSSAAARNIWRSSWFTFTSPLYMKFRMATMSANLQNQLLVTGYAQCFVSYLSILNGLRFRIRIMKTDPDSGNFKNIKKLQKSNIKLQCCGSWSKLNSLSATLWIRICIPNIPVPAVPVPYFSFQANIVLNNSIRLLKKILNITGCAWRIPSFLFKIH